MVYLYWLVYSISLQLMLSLALYFSASPPRLPAAAPQPELAVPCSLPRPRSSAGARLAAPSRTSPGPLLRSSYRPRAELAPTRAAPPLEPATSHPRALLLVTFHLLATAARLPRRRRRRLRGVREIPVRSLLPLPNSNPRSQFVSDFSIGLHNFHGG